jgi:hypothetical protein
MNFPEITKKENPLGNDAKRNEGDKIPDKRQSQRPDGGLNGRGKKTPT